jgi:IMP dehydrogenase
MMGGVLAGTDHSPGEKIIYQGRQFVTYRGMGSLGAMQTGAGSRERYGQKDIATEDLVPQGIEGLVPYAGTVKQVLTQYCGGLKASLGYCGLRTIEELKRKGRFVRVSSAGVSEAHPHDIKITKEAPNYRM